MVRTSAPMREDSNAESLAMTPGFKQEGQLLAALLVLGTPRMFDSLEV